MGLLNIQDPLILRPDGGNWVGAPYGLKPGPGARPDFTHPRCAGSQFVWIDNTIMGGQVYDHAHHQVLTPSNSPTWRQNGQILFNQTVTPGQTWHWPNTNNSGSWANYSGTALTFYYEVTLLQVSIAGLLFCRYSGLYQYAVGHSLSASKMYPSVYWPSAKSLVNTTTELFADETYRIAIRAGNSLACECFVLHPDGSIGHDVGSAGGTPSNRSGSVTLGARGPGLTNFDCDARLAWLRVYQGYHSEEQMLDILKNPWREYYKPVPVFINAPAAAGEIATMPLGSLSLSDLATSVLTTENKTAEAPVGTLSLTGNTFSVFESETAQLPLGSLTLNGFTFSVHESETAQFPLGSLSLNALTATVETSEDKFSDLPLGALTLNDLAATVDVTVGEEAVVPLGTLTLTALSLTAQTSEDVTAQLPLGSLSLNALSFTADVPEENVAEMPLGSLVLNDLAATALLSDHQFADLPLGNLQLNALSFNVLDSDIAQIPLGSLTLNPLTFTVETTTIQFAQVPTGNLQLNALTPTVETTEEKVAQIPLGNLQLNVFFTAVIVTEPGGTGNASTTSSNLRSGPGILDLPVR